MSLNQKKTSEVLSRLDWQQGLTRDDIVKLIQERDDLDSSDLIHLYRSLPEGRQFHNYEEALNAVAPSSWER